jgi:hypothetical protein
MIGFLFLYGRIYFEITERGANRENEKGGNKENIFNRWRTGKPDPTK